MSFANIPWDQVGSYNLGTAVTGFWLMVIGARAAHRLHGLSRALALAFAMVGLYICYRGGWWFTAHQAAPDGELYHDWYVRNRWTIWGVIVPMECAILGLYMRAFSDKLAIEAIIVGSVVGSYILGGLL